MFFLFNSTSKGKIFHKTFELLTLYVCCCLQVSSRLGEDNLNKLPVGSHVGLSVNSKRDLLLYVNGQLKGTIATAVPDTVYFAVQLCYNEVNLVLTFRLTQYCPLGVDVAPAMTTHEWAFTTCITILSSWSLMLLLF
jgi:hypothetical protein